jgi:hypothetical protein
MDVETPARGRDKTEGFAQERRRMSCRGISTELDLGGCSLFSGTLALEGLGRHP